MKGGKDALFIPDNTLAPDEPLLVTEGPTDAAALLDMGFANAVGRASCAGGIKHVVALVRQRRPKAVVVVADADEPGRRGAAQLSRTLALHVPYVKVISPPERIKDARRWKLAGATHEDLDRVLADTPAERLTITTTYRGNR